MTAHTPTTTAPTGPASVAVTAVVLTCVAAAVGTLVVGLVTRAPGPRGQLRATLGTAVVTLPLFAMGWALLASAGGVAGFLGTLHTTGHCTSRSR